MDKNQAILRQVEYYFSDDSFPFDDFLKTLASAEGKDGYVDISVLAGFGKMKTFIGDAADPVATVVAALEGSDSLEIRDDKQAVRRLFPIPSEDPAAERTVFAAQFLSEEARAKLEETFSVFGKVEAVRALRNLASDERPFDGGVHIRFAKAESVAKAIAAAEKGEIEGTAGPALLKTLAEHYDDFMKKRLGMRKKREGGGDGGEGGGKKRKVVEVAPFDEEYTRGIIVELKGLGEGADREIIKTACEKFGPVGWVEYERDGESAQVRFNEKEHAKALCDAADIGLEGFANTKGSLLDGEAERAYWVKKHEDTAKRMASRGGKGKGRRGKGGKGRRRN